MAVKNKLFYKIGLTIISVVIVYTSVIVFTVSPKVTSYLTNVEKKQAETQLQRVEAIIDSKEKYIKDYKIAKEIEFEDKIRDISNIVYEIFNSNYKMYQEGILSKSQAIEKSFQSIANINYGYSSDYNYILKSDGTIFYHPYHEYLAKNIYEIEDRRGRKFIKELIQEVKQSNESFIRYSWSNLDRVGHFEKIAHGLYFKPLDLVIVSSVSTQEVDDEVEAEKNKIIFDLQLLIESITKEEAAYVFVVDGDGKMIIHPNKKVLNKNINQIMQMSKQTSFLENINKVLTSNKPIEYKWNRKSDPENFIYEKLAWVKHNSFFDWYLGSTVYKDDIELKAKEINQLILGVSFLLLFVISFIAIFFVEKYLKPISILSAHAKAVKNGDFQVRNDIKTNDELGLLSEQFNTMLDFIEANTKDLEKKVEDRTKEIKYKLFHDSLTGLRNRDSLLDDLKDIEFSALNLIKIDNFDDINELYGFEVGDEVLLQISKYLSKFAKDEGFGIYRVLSGTFALLDTKIQNFLSYDLVVKKIQDAFKQPIKIESLQIGIIFDVTIGVSISQTKQLSCATIALKSAMKKDEKFAIYNKSIDTKKNIQRTVYWKNKIKESLKADKVVPFFQPIYNNKNELIKYEVLMRMEDEIDGKISFITPGNFLFIAIKTKQYFALNKVIMQKAFGNLEKIKKDISINLSFNDIMNINYMQILKEEVDKLSKEQRKRIVFEILESEDITDYKILSEFIEEYRNKGIRIAIDDFGTGFSNFSYILKIKPDYIKIDGSLIKDINIDENSYEIVKTIVTFCKSLGIKVIAEFIHSKEVYEIVKELDVDEFQGYFLGEPEPLEQ